MTLSFDLTADPAPHDLAVIGEGLSTFNDSDVGPAGRQSLVIFVRGEDGEIAGGLSGHTAWGWLFVQWLWLAEALRGQGVAAQLLAIAEAEAVRRGCHGAWIDTFNLVALKIYRRAGYVPFGALEDFPQGRTRTFLQKRLNP